MAGTIGWWCGIEPSTVQIDTLEMSPANSGAQPSGGALAVPKREPQDTAGRASWARRAAIGGDGRTLGLALWVNHREPSPQTGEGDQRPDGKPMKTLRSLLLLLRAAHIGARVFTARKGLPSFLRD